LYLNSIGITIAVAPKILKLMQKLYLNVPKLRIVLNNFHLEPTRVLRAKA